MFKLGFGASGYIAQGGDVGSGVASHMVKAFDECIGRFRIDLALLTALPGELGSLRTKSRRVGAHVNMLPMAPPQKEGVAPPTEQELTTLKRAEEFRTTGMAYAMMHATKPSTVGLVVASSPQGLLSWWVETSNPGSHQSSLGSEGRQEDEML